MGELVCFCGSRVMKNKVDIWVLLAYILFFKMKLTKVRSKTRIDPIHTIETNIIFHVFEDLVTFHEFLISQCYLDFPMSPLHFLLWQFWSCILWFIYIYNLYTVLFSLCSLKPVRFLWYWCPSCIKKIYFKKIILYNKSVLHI